MAIVERCRWTVLDLTVYEATRTTDESEQDVVNERASIWEEQTFIATGW